jgi:hypothetical protein
MIVDRDFLGPTLGDQLDPYETVRVLVEAARGRAMRPRKPGKATTSFSRAKQQHEVDSVRFRRAQARS